MNKIILSLTALIISSLSFGEYNIKSIEPDNGPSSGGTVITIKFENTNLDISLPFTVKFGSTDCIIKETVIIDNKLLSAVVQTTRNNYGPADIEAAITLKTGGILKISKSKAFMFNAEGQDDFKDERSIPAYKQNKKEVLLENTSGWLQKEKETGKQEWNSFWDDLFTNAPGDSWEDFDRYYEFTLSGIFSTILFYSMTFNGVMPSDARLKSFLISTCVVLAVQELGCLTDKSRHFCAKTTATGTFGSLVGGYIFTLYLN